MIDPAWEGSVQFYELVFGTWLAYAFLAVMWDRVIRCPLDEWKYVLITFIGAGAFWVNHYFQHAPFYSRLLNIYTIGFIVIYYLVAVRGHGKSLIWQVGTTLSSILFTVAFILFENIARFAVARGIQEFWPMLVAFAGFVGLICWRGLRRKT